MYVRNKLLTDTILSEPTWKHICFADGDDGVPGAGGAGDPPPGDDDGLDLGDDTPPPNQDDDLVEVEIGADKLKVDKRVKAMVDGVHAKTQTEREALKAREAAITQQESRFKETEKMRTALLDEIAEVRSVEKAKKAVETQMSEYQKLSTDDWMRWNEQDPEAAKRGQTHYQALQMQRGNLQTNIEGIMESVRTKGGQLEEQNRQVLAEHAARQAQIERDLPSKIKDWSPAKREAIVKAAVEHGLTADEVAPFMTDARVINILDKVAKYDAAVARAAKAKAAADQTKQDDQPPVDATPAMRTGSGKASSAPRDDDDAKTWLRKREAEVAARRKAAGGRR